MLWFFEINLSVFFCANSPGLLWSDSLFGKLLGAERER